MLGVFRSVDAFNDAYTVYTFDYRGSGKSSYNGKITSLKDFGADFDKVVDKIGVSPASGVTPVGYSMGFGVALELVSLTGIGTRATKYDLKRAGASVTAMMVNPNQGFDHGFTIARPLETVRLIDAFIQGDVSPTAAASALGAGAAVYPNAETARETAVFTGF